MKIEKFLLMDDVLWIWFLPLSISRISHFVFHFIFCREREKKSVIDSLSWTIIIPDQMEDFIGMLHFGTIQLLTLCQAREVF